MGKRQILTNLTHLKVSREKGGIKLERMKKLHFNGIIREYPRFKSDFLKQVIQEIGSKDKAAYALKSCLSVQPYTKKQNVYDDIDMMWKRLDDIYGRPSKIVDEFMFNIKRFKAFSNEELLFIEFVQAIENGFLDLKRLKIGH